MKPGETIFPEASMILSAGCDLSVPTEVIVSPSVSTEPLRTSSWLVPDQPTTMPPSIRIFMDRSFWISRVLLLDALPNSRRHSGQAHASGREPESLTPLCLQLSREEI